MFNALTYIKLTEMKVRTQSPLSPDNMQVQEEDNSGLPAFLLAQREKEIKLSRVSLIIVAGDSSSSSSSWEVMTVFSAVFIACHSIKWIPNLYELHQSGIPGQELEWPNWIRETFKVFRRIIPKLFRVDEQLVEPLHNCQLRHQRLHLFFKTRKVCDQFDCS